MSKKRYIIGIIFTVVAIVIGVLYIFTVAPYFLNESYERMKSKITLTLDSKEMVCYDIEVVGAEVGLDEPFKTETRYYTKAVDDSEASSDDWGYIINPHKPFELGEQYIKYTIVATVPATAEIDPYKYTEFKVHYYDETQEDLYRIKAIEKAEKHIAEVIEQEKTAHYLSAFGLAAVIIIITWLVVWGTGVEKQCDDLRTL